MAMVSGLSEQRGFREWPRSGADHTPGYTVLIPCPGDLPVFLKIALDVCASQDDVHRVETLVVPDIWTPALSELLAGWAREYAVPSVRLVRLRPTDQLLVRHLAHPHVNYWLQVVRGVEATCSSHVLLHDVDLFVTDPRLFEAHYRACLARDLACLGVDRPWDGWYEAHGITHVVSTWELICETSWFRSFTPLDHRGHDRAIDGHLHAFDITFWPQYQTDPARIGLHDVAGSFIHLNHLICAYRWFQRRVGPFEDRHFRLLLIRLLADAYDPGGHACGEVPQLAELIDGITDGSRRVTYPRTICKDNYAGFRSKLQRLITGGGLDAAKASSLLQGVLPFDRAFSPYALSAPCR